MAIPVIMPRQGQSVEFCIITEIFKSVGDQVEKGDLLFSYETDKASFDEESPEAGTLLAVFFKPGDEVPVLTNVLVLGNKGESVKEFAPGEVKNTGVADSEAEKFSKGSAIPLKNSSNKTGKTTSSGFISPRARLLAERKGVDISDISGTGPGGRIIERDIVQAIESGLRMTPLARKKAKAEGLVPPEKGSRPGGKITSKDLVSGKTTIDEDVEIIPLSNMRKLIAGSMYRSLQNSAQLTHHLSADARQLLEMREQVKKRIAEGFTVNITINDMVCLAVIRTLKRYPRINAHFMGESLKTFRNVHLGIAVDTDRGLMVPTVVNAGQLSIKDISVQLKNLADACRKGNVNPDLLIPDSASFTVSNLGKYGVEMFTPIINLPQVAILGVNTILPRPKDLGNGVFGFVPHIGLSFTYDHRALDGGEATRFLKDLATEIEQLEFKF